MNIFIIILFLLCFSILLYILYTIRKLQGEEKTKIDTETRFKQIIEQQEYIRNQLFEVSKGIDTKLFEFSGRINEQVNNVLNNTTNLILQQINNAVQTMNITDTRSQERIDALREQVQKTLFNATQSLTENIRSTTLQLTDQVDKRLGDLDKRVGDATSLVSEIVEGVKSGLTTLLGDIGEFKKVTTELKEALAPPKLRGEVGEFILENLLRECLPAECYEKEYKLTPEERVDVVIKLDGKLLPIDAKFPLDLYKKAIKMEDKKEKERLLKSFFEKIKDHINEIASKYIRPDYGTFDFAFMYIPSETVFYETIILGEKDENIYGYAMRKKVIPTSPNSFFAYLQLLLLGVRGVQLEKNIKRVIEALDGLSGDLARMKVYFERAKKQVSDAQGNLTTAGYELDRFVLNFDQLRKLKSLPPE